MTAEAITGPIKVLVVDDQIGMRLTLKGILSKKGYQVSLAEDGFKALEEAAKTKFNVIFMDVKMPGMSGVETFIKMKEINPNAAVIMMTAFALEDEIKLAIKEGAYAVMHKPFNMEKMFDLIAECLENRPLVLVVDDSVIERQLLLTLLDDKGYKMCSVETGEECLSQLAAKRYQVILLDISLPGMDGIETLKKVKELRPDTAVIMVSGHSEKELLEKAMKEGSYAYLHKPFDASMLVDVMEKCVASNKGLVH
jgi:DNA-binding NtrC family response regulator